MTFSPATRAVRSGIDSDRAHGAVIPPITLSATFRFDSLDETPRPTITRAAAIPPATCSPAPSPTSRAVPARWSRRAGWARLPPSSMRCSRPANGFWRRTIAMAEAGGCSPRSPRRACSSFTHAVTSPIRRSSAPRSNGGRSWCGSKPRPILCCGSPISIVIGQARAVGALTVADNTFLSPALQRPIAFGADVVVHSTTKYINGHSDVVGGAMVARDPAVLDQLQYWANALGVTGSPFDSYLTFRGLRTLGARLRIHQENAAALAELLANNPAVAQVHYPGLANHPGHDIAARQQDGFGAMLSFELAGGGAAVRAFVDGLTCFTLAESLGGVESLVAYPLTMSHAVMSEEARQCAGIGPALLRVSVGIEHVDDLIADFGAALDRAAAVSSEAVRC